MSSSDSESPTPRPAHFVARRKAETITSIPAQLFPVKLGFKLPFKGLVKVVKRVVHRKQSRARARAFPSLPLPSLDIPTASVGSVAEKQTLQEPQTSTSSLSLVSLERHEMADYLSAHSELQEGGSQTPSGPFEETDPALGSEPMFTSPPTVYIEPEVPDPFLIDSDDESDEESGATPTESQQAIAPAHDVPLAPVAAPSSPNLFGSPLQSPNRNKDVPPPPQSDSDEEEAPELYLPGLCIPTMFLPIPNVRVSSPHLLIWWLRPLMYTSRRPIR